MLKNLKKVLLLSIFPFILNSCISSLQYAAQETPLELIPKNKVLGGFSFVIPDNFSFVNDQSLVYNYKGDVRAFLVYVGKGSIIQIINFFTDYMPEKGWKPDFTSVSTDGMIAFRKGNRLIVIKVSPDIAGVSYIKILLTK